VRCAEGEEITSRWKFRFGRDQFKLAGRTFVLVTLVIVIAPIAVRAPTMFVFIPPTVIGIPAALTGFAELSALVLSLTAAIAMLFDSFMELVVGLGDPLLAFVLVSANVRRGEEHKARKHCAGQKRFGKGIFD
jgi:hypothetical protein